MSSIEPAVIIRPQHAEPGVIVALAGDGVRDGLPEWVYDGYTRITPRQVASAVLYTATGAFDLRPVIDLMLDNDAAKTIRHALDTPSVLLGRHDLEALRDAAYGHMRQTWATYLDGIDL